MPEKASLSITVYGLVQGVFFRDFVWQHAIALDLRGYVRNLPQGRSVEIRAEGRREQLEKLLEYVKVGPRRAKIEEIKANWSEYTGILPEFEIRYWHGTG
jgi:acylphosphatase